jgi:hypothetical protein
MTDDFIALLRDELAEMASTASVDMELWNRFSNRVLKAANVIEEQAVRIEEIAEQYNSFRLTPVPEKMLKEATNEIAQLRARIVELEAALNTQQLTSEELKAAEKHCDWVAFKHAFNAVMNLRAARAAYRGEKE